MLYQVMIRTRARKGYTGYAVWEPFAGPTGDPYAAMQLVRQANQRRAEALVVQAEDADDLAELVRHMRGGLLTDAPTAVEIAETAPPTPLTHSTERATEHVTEHVDGLSFAEELLASWDTLRWELERGPGGDHDTPYRFTLPTSNNELRSWLRLMLRYQHRTSAHHES